MVAICAMCFSCEIYSYLFGFSVCIFCCLLFPLSSKCSLVLKNFPSLSHEKIYWLDDNASQKRALYKSTRMGWDIFWSLISYFCASAISWLILQIFEHPWCNHTVKDVNAKKYWILKVLGLICLIQEIGYALSMFWCTYAVQISLVYEIVDEFYYIRYLLKTGYSTTHLCISNLLWWYPRPKKMTQWKL